MGKSDPPGGLGKKNKHQNLFGGIDEMPQYTLPATARTVPVVLGASATFSGVLPTQNDKNVLVIQVTTGTNAFIVFAASSGSLAAANGMKLTSGDTFALFYDANTQYFMMYTTAGGALNALISVNGNQP